MSGGTDEVSAAASSPTGPRRFQQNETTWSRFDRNVEAMEQDDERGTGIDSP